MGDLNDGTKGIQREMKGAGAYQESRISLEFIQTPRFPGERLLKLRHAMQELRIYDAGTLHGRRGSRVKKGEKITSK